MLLKWFKFSIENSNVKSLYLRAVFISFILYSNNAFRNSIFYEHTRNILFVRHERMESIGEFVMVIVHSLAHIHSGDMTDDRNTLFLRQFYKVCLLISCVLMKIDQYF